GETFGFTLDTPWKSLNKKQRQAVLYGTGKNRITVRFKNRFGRERSHATVYEGVIPHLNRRHDDTESEHQREQLESYMRLVPCHDCDGTRLKESSLAVTIGDESIAGLCNLCISDAADFLGKLELTEREALIA